MKFKVEGVSKFGIKSDTKWFNPSKFDPIDFSQVKRGDLVDVTLNAKGYMTAITVEGSVPMSAPTTSSTETPRANSPMPSNNGFRTVDQAQIARSVALKSVLESKMLADQALALQLTPSEYEGFIANNLNKYASYIITGTLLGTLETTEVK